MGHRSVGLLSWVLHRGGRFARESQGTIKEAAGAGNGDVLVVWRLDRLGRSLIHLVEVINGLRDAGIGFRSLQEQIDTTSAKVCRLRTKGGFRYWKIRGNWTLVSRDCFGLSAQ